MTTLKFNLEWPRSLAMQHDNDQEKSMVFEDGDCDSCTIVMINLTLLI